MVDGEGSAARCRGSATVTVRRTKEPAIATVTIIESRVMLALLLLSGGIILLLAALVDLPVEGHGHAEAAASSGEHAPGEPATAESAVDPAERAGHSAETAATPETAGSAKTEHGGGSEEASEPSGEGHQPDSFFGVDVGSLNLATPRLTIVIIGLTLLFAVALAIRQSKGLLAAAIGLGLAGVAVGVHEGTHAGEELGILVSLPILAAVVYGGAAGLAGLAIVALQARSEATGHE
jgi:hypothetical protein